MANIFVISQAVEGSVIGKQEGNHNTNRKIGLIG